MSTRSINPLGTFDRWLFESYQLNANHWGLFRITYALYMLVFVGLPELTYLAGLPDAFFNPPRISIGQLASGYPGYAFLQILGLLIVGLFLCILFGYRTRTASIAGATLAVFAKSFVYSTGQINHDFMVWMVPVAGAFANWGAAYSLDSKSTEKKNSEVHNWPIMFLVIAFTFALALSGYKKYLGGWASLEFAAVNQSFIRNYIVVQREYLMAPHMINFDSFIFWKALDYLTLVFEIGIVVGIVFPKVFRWFLLATVGFHASNLLLLNIDFSFNFAFYALFLPWNRIEGWVKLSRIGTLLDSMIQPKVAWVVSLAYLIFFLLTESSLATFSFGLVGVDYLGNAVFRTSLAATIAAWLIFDFLTHLRSREKQTNRHVAPGSATLNSPLVK
jgi:hypothetical protein